MSTGHSPLRRPAGLPDRLDEDSTLVMGVLNVTPDSFSDGGAHDAPPAAIAHGRRLVAQGAAIVDVGGESTRPGAPRVDEDEELRRVLPVVSALAAEDIVVSVDTMRASVAAASVEAGALIVNDVSAGRADVDMGGEAARLRTHLGTPPVFIAMHWRGHSHDMQTRAVYDDVVAEVRSELQQRVEALVGAGIGPDRLVIDPGLGFAKTHRHNWQLLARVDELSQLGLPVLMGASRKGFLGQVGARGDGPVPAGERDAATAATSVLLARSDVWGIRVHDVPSTRAAVEVVAAVREADEAHG